MVTEAISGLNLKEFEFIYLVGLKEHEDKYNYFKGLNQELNYLGIGNKTEVILLDSPTKSQPETIDSLIKLKDLSGPIFVKDSDNYFEKDITPGNQVCYYNLNNSDNINPRNKSYITLDCNSQLSNIVEKKVIGPYFSVGGYGFEDAKEFSKVFEYLKGTSIEEAELSTSHIIFQMLIEDKLFLGNEVSSYLDWGTIEDWDRYKSQYITVFVDLDGTLVEHSSKCFPPYIGETRAIEDNVKILRDLHNKGKAQIIITTARPETYRDITVNQLRENDIPYDSLIMNLMHSKRVIINDYSPSNPFKSCDSINIKRNSKELDCMLRDIIKK